MADKQFSLERFFLKDLSFESPQGVNVFLKEWKPHVNVDLSSSNKKIDDVHYQVDLRVTVTAKQDEEVAFIAEVEQSGVFACQGFSDEEIKQILSVNCPTILFPYARETIDSVIIKGSFPALRLAPINFEALYMQSQQNADSETTH